MYIKAELDQKMRTSNHMVSSAINNKFESSGN